MQLKSLLLATILPLSITLAACTGGTSAQSEAVKARTDTMKNWKDAKDAMESMIEAPDTFDAETFKEEAQFLAENSTTPWRHFSDENEVGGANTTVWSDPEGFRAAAENFEQTTAELNSVAQTATSAEEVQPAFSAMGQSCKSCHESFKAPSN